MSQTAAMKAVSRLLPKKSNSTRNNDAFTHCGISLISPNTLHQKHSRKVSGFSSFHRDGGTLFGPVYRGESGGVIWIGVCCGMECGTLCDVE